MKLSFKLITAAIMTAILIKILYGQQPEVLQNKITGEWKELSTVIIQEHLAKHPNCEYQGAVEVLDKLKVYFYKRGDISPHFRAVAFPAKDTDTQMIVVNIWCNSKWSEYDAVLMYLHEVLHLIFRNGNWVCGPDGPLNTRLALASGRALCRLFGESQYASFQVTESIEKHLSAELSTLNKRRAYDSR